MKLLALQTQEQTGRSSDVYQLVGKDEILPGEKKEEGEECVPAPVRYPHSHERFLPVSIPATALETGFVNSLALKEKK